MSSPRRPAAGRVHRIVFGAVMSVVLIFFGGIVAARATHTQMLPVLSGSMHPTIAVDALVLARPVTATQVRVGDVAVFAHPENPTVMVMHRVVELGTVDGVLTAHTRGDANTAVDPWTLDLSRTTLHRVDAAVPYAGRLHRLAHATTNRLTPALLWPGLLGVLAAAALATHLRRRRTTTCPAADHTDDHTADHTALIPAAGNVAAVVSPETAEEMRHRLTAIIGYSEILTDDLDDRAGVVQMADTVRHHAQRLTAVLDDLNRLSTTQRP